MGAEYKTRLTPEEIQRRITAPLSKGGRYHYRRHGFLPGPDYKDGAEAAIQAAGL